MSLDTKILNESFALLGQMLAAGEHAPLHLVVSGGAALLATGIVSRTTNDVDVLAVRGEIDGDLSTAWPLPEYVKAFVSEIAGLKALDANWLNAATSMMMIPLSDFPTKAWADLDVREFGESLKVSFVGRSGQIYLKMYARIGRKVERDLIDLRALDLSKKEALQVARWIFDMELVSPRFPSRLFELLIEINHENVVDILKSEI